MQAPQNHIVEIWPAGTNGEEDILLLGYVQGSHYMSVEELRDPDHDPDTYDLREQRSELRRDVRLLQEEKETLQREVRQLREEKQQLQVDTAQLREEKAQAYPRSQSYPGNV
ncbi:uncharacterized protein LOC144911443 isoform X2 [Branchiostoma floridae x Branchiostoma belcheri]